MGSRGTRGRTGYWVAGRLGEKRRGREREQVSAQAGWLAALAGLAGRKGLGWAAGGLGGLLRSAGCRLTLLFLFVPTEIETEKHRVKGEEFEYKENILKLLELSTI